MFDMPLKFKFFKPFKCRNLRTYHKLCFNRFNYQLSNDEIFDQVLAISGPSQWTLAKTLKTLFTEKAETVETPLSRYKGVFPREPDIQKKSPKGEIFVVI